MKKTIGCFLVICLLFGCFPASALATEDEIIVPCADGPQFKADGNWRPSGLKGEGELASKYTINNDPTKVSFSADLEEGNYRVYFDNMIKGDNAEKIKITITHKNGETAAELQHNKGTSGYTDLGVYAFSKAQPAVVTVERIQEKIMRIASVKFVKTTDAPGSTSAPSPSAQPPVVPVGEEAVINVGENGYWESEGWAQSGLMGWNGKPSRYSPENEAEAWASFTANLSGRYQVYFYNIVNQNGHDDPKITVQYDGGENVIRYSGKKGANGFLDLGIYEFKGGIPAVVTVRKTGAGPIRTSAVKFVPTTEEVMIKSEATPAPKPTPKETTLPRPIEKYAGIRVLINDKEQKYDQMPQLVNDRTLVPMRGIFESLGAKIQWDEVTQTVMGSTQDHQIQLTIGDTTAMVDGQETALDTAAMLINDRTMVPVRFIAESMGADVEWVEEENLVEITKNDIKESYEQIKLKDLGAKADGVTDDGPVIQKALDMAKEKGGYCTIVFEENKTYYIGPKPDSWQYFVLDGMEHIYFDGNGSELIFERTNGMFRLHQCKYVTFDGLNLDLSMPNYFQGEVLEINKEEFSFTAKKMDGYPDPKVGKENVSAGGGMHGTTFDQETGKKPHHLSSSLNPKSVEDLGNGIFKFTVSDAGAMKEAFGYLKPGQIYTIGLTGKDVPEEYTKQRAYYPMSSFVVSYSGDIEWKDTNLYASMAMGMTLTCNEGNLYFNRYAIRRKPGTDRMLAVPSDGIHPRNNRGSLNFNDCYFEASGDDLLSIHQKDEKIDKQVSPTEYVLSSSSGDYMPYQKGDELLFINRKTGEIYGRTYVERVISDETAKTNTVTLSHEVEGLTGVSIDPSAIFVQNMGFSAKGTVVKNSTFRPVHRNAMLLRFSDSVIENNVIESLGGQGITILGEGNTGVINHNLVIRNNQFVNTLQHALRIGTSIFNRHPSGMFHQNILVENNEINVSEGNGIHVTDANQVTLKGNYIAVNEDQWGLDSAKLSDDYALRFVNCYNIIAENNEIVYSRKESQAPTSAVCIENSEKESIQLIDNTFSIPGTMSESEEK